MNMMRTAMLLAFMTALFMGVGFLIGGKGGMMIALVIAAGMNIFPTGTLTRWFSPPIMRGRSTRRMRPNFSHDPRPVAECRSANAEGLYLR